jgi:anti-anti-sigma regulatory factor
MLTERNGSTITVVLSKERPANYFTLLSEELISYKGQGIKKIIFDATELMYLKGEGVSHVVSACKEMGSKPEVVFVNCPKEIQDMLGLVGLDTIIKFETNQALLESVREKKYHNLKEEAIQRLDEHRHKLLEEFAAKNDVVCYTMKLGQEE